MTATVINQRMMLQAIQTKYISPSNTKDARVKATAQAGSITLHWDHALNSDQNHAKAAITLANKYGWEGEMVGGGLKDTNVFVFINRDEAKV